MKRLMLTGLAAGLLLGGGNSGLPPRASCSEYAGCASAKAVAIGARALTAAEAKKVFAADLDRAGYVVFEVAVFPADGSTADLALRDFVLRAGNGAAYLQAAGPDVVALAAIPDPAMRDPRPQPPGNVHVTSESTVGYSSGGYGRKGGVYAGEGVGVDNYPSAPPPPPTSNPNRDRKRDDLQHQLADRALPAGPTSAPLAGYLYFPKPNRAAKSTQYQLTWSGGDTPVRVSVPPAK